MFSNPHIPLTLLFLSTATVILAATPQCPGDFDVGLNGKCFCMGRERKSFDAAWIECAKSNATLASISSQQENDFLTELAAVAGINDGRFTTVFLGGVKNFWQPDPAKFMWMDGSDFSAFQAWTPGCL